MLIYTQDVFYKRTIDLFKTVFVIIFKILSVLFQWKNRGNLCGGKRIFFFLSVVTNKDKNKKIKEYI